jgi:hypothetical protein
MCESDSRLRGEVENAAPLGHMRFALGPRAGLRGAQRDYGAAFAYAIVRLFPEFNW